jgi:hypothetical protein
MTYRGHIKGGVVVLDEPVDLPEGTEVRIEPAIPDEKDLESLREGLLKFAGIAKGLPSDLAKNHDHYLHGLPKKP